MIRPHRETFAFTLTLAGLLACFFHQSLFCGKILSPADVLYVQHSFPGRGADYEPANRLLIDPVLQFEPWLAFSRSEIRAGRLPLWNPHAGFGAPLLANGQSAIFDPIHLIAYLGPLPDALAWMAALRLWIAGLGMYLLARAWGLGAAGRWYAGLTFPFCGFLIVWLQFPVTPSAIWLPWLLLTTCRVLEKPGARSVATLAAFTALSFLAGHVQTTAHLLLASGLLVLFELAHTARQERSGKWLAAACWGGGIALGVGLAAVQLLPLGTYLSRSPVWLDRLAERAREGSIPSTRLPDSLCTLVPYLFGSQRYGHPNIAKFLGVHNLNESAAGYAGMPAWLILAPLGLSAIRINRRVPFLLTLLMIGFCLAFAIPPFPALTAPLPILNVIDHRRLTLWIAFALTMLAAIGLDRLLAIRPRRIAIQATALLAILALGLALAITFTREPLQRMTWSRLQARVAVADTADHARLKRHIENAINFYPRYAAANSAELFALASLLLFYRRNRIQANYMAGMVIGLTLIDLVAFGYGLNPEIVRVDAIPASPVIERLRQVCPFPARVLAIDTELPPNTLMRYGLCDLRNYDSIELRSTLEYCEPLFASDPSPTRTSRKEIGWPEIMTQKERLISAGVRAIVSRSTPPPEFRNQAEQQGAVWITKFPGPEPIYTHVTPGKIRIDDTADPGHPKSLAVSFDRGWTARADGRVIPVESSQSTFLAVPIPPGVKSIQLSYEPLEVQVGLWVSGLLLFVWLCLFIRLPIKSYPPNRP